MSKKLSWGILGTGGIAGTFAEGISKSSSGKLVAIGSRSQEKASAFAAKWNIPNSHGSYKALLSNHQVEAVYIALPHPMHAEWAIKGTEAGKHILCEKPLALNHADAMVVIESAYSHDVFLMEAFMYRCHPQTAKLVELIRKGAIGQVRFIQASFSFKSDFNPASRLFSHALGGGGILDVGCYPVSMARLIAGAAQNKDFAEPVEVKGSGCIGKESRVDEWTAAILKFPGDIIAQVSAGVSVNHENVVRVFGTKGNILLLQPWMPCRNGGRTQIIVNYADGKRADKIIIESGFLYAIEADTVAKNIDARQAAPPAMTWADTLGNMKTLDAWREAIGMIYDAEKPEGNAPPVHHRPLAVRKDSNMVYDKLPALQKKISRLAIGVSTRSDTPYVNAMLDDFFERGGNCIDTAYIYGGGACEKAIGHWIQSRSVREQVVVLDKGAHTPECNPDGLSKQLTSSLERLKTDYIDIYLMHRDNPDIPVDEFVDILNEHKAAGRIRVFGGSNWTIERIEAFNTCAKEKGLSEFAVVSNNFSLARMIAPPWDGCLSCSDPIWRAWFKKRHLALFPWSSQAQGFFVRANTDERKDKELVRCWYSDDNFARLERAREIAAKRNVLPINIALAYVLSQPFLTFPIIGPSMISETRTSLQALNIELSPHDLHWLNLED